jgi:hypothetical protein
MGVIVTASIFILPTTHLTASLIICCFHNHELYVGADSLVSFLSDTRPETNIASFNTEKIFPLPPTCIAAMVNWSGLQRQKRSGEFLTPELNAALKLICTNLASVDAPLHSKIEEAVGSFGKEFATEARTKLKMSPEVMNSDLETVLAFMGYDQDVNEFFISTYRFSATNLDVYRKRTGTVWEIQVDFFTWARLALCMHCFTRNNCMTWVPAICGM